jgi:hypothetical protein
MKTVLVCGDRDWEYYDAIEACLQELLSLRGYGVLIHGDARGADRMAGQAGDMLGMLVHAVPAEWDKHGRAAGAIRNRKMLDMKPDLVVAFHNDLAKSKGTKDCVTEARRRSIPVILVTHTETLLDNETSLPPRSD